MTQIGKCDTCRARKVKCDEQKPRCGACTKKERPCTYTYGKPSALVLENPTEFSRYGKAKVAPRVVPLLSDRGESSDSKSVLRISSEKEAEKGDGVFHTLEMKSKSRASHQLQRRKKWSPQSQKSSPDNTCLTIHQPTSPETALAIRFMNMIGPKSLKNPFLVHGAWLNSVPTRLGVSRAFDTAVEFAVDSFTYFMDGSFTNNGLARASKGKALKELRLALKNTPGHVGFDVLIAIKLHYSAEIFMGVEDWINYTLHSMALSEILKSRVTTEIYDPDYWDFFDSTYIDEVAEATFAGRPSKYDNEFYLSITRCPELKVGLDPATSLLYRTSVAIVHSFIQTPRLVHLVRKAISNPDDVAMLAEAVSHAEYLWALDPASLIEEYMQINTMFVPVPPSPEIADVIPETLSFESVQSIMTLARYWTLRIYICGAITSLINQFPVETAASLLPDRDAVEKVEVTVAMYITQSIPWAVNLQPKLQLLPLRILSPVQTSLGTWFRFLHRRRTNSAFHDPTSPEVIRLTEEIDRYQRIQDWSIAESNKIHRSWGAEEVRVEHFEVAADILAGGEIPEILQDYLKDLQAGKKVANVVEKISDLVKDAAEKRRKGEPYWKAIKQWGGGEW